MSRSDEIKTERRRRTTAPSIGRNRLSVNKEHLDPNYAYRFVNTEPGRVEAFTTQDDWEVVQDRDGKMKTDNAGQGSQVAAYVGTDEQGKPMQAVLLRKKREYHDEDYAAQQRLIDEKENATRTQTVQDGDSSEMYVPGGKNAPMSITR